MKKRKLIKSKKLNKTAILAAIALSLSYGATANASLSSELFNLKEVGSYSIKDLLARCGSGSCGSTESTVPSHAAQINEEEDSNEPETLQECKKECKEEYEKGAPEFKQCKKECKKKFK